MGDALSPDKGQSGCLARDSMPGSKTMGQPEASCDPGSAAPSLYDLRQVIGFSES